MKRSVWLFALLGCGSAEALEWRYGQGDFTWHMGIEGVAIMQMSTPITSLSLAQPHTDIAQSGWFFSADAELFGSAQVDRMSRFFATPITQDWPIGGSIDDQIDAHTPMQLPADYTFRGFDADLALGYDWLDTKHFRAGAGIQTGLSMPYMQMKNLRQSAERLLDVLETTQTDIMTYKLALSLSAALTYGAWTLEGDAAHGQQYGSIENRWIRSTLNVKGAYTRANLTLRYTVVDLPLEVAKMRPKLYLLTGYMYKSWDLHRIEVHMVDAFETDTPRSMQLDFTLAYMYAGAGITF